MVIGCYGTHGDSAEDAMPDHPDAEVAAPDSPDTPTLDDAAAEDCAPDCTDRQCGDDGCGGVCPPGCDPGLECDSTGRCNPPETCVGGWLDTTTGLCWQNPSEDDVRGTAEQGIAYCANLSRGEFGPGSWYLPTIGELRSLVRGCPPTETGGRCNVSDACTEPRCVNAACSGCEAWAGPGELGAYQPPELRGNGVSFTGVWLWSSTPQVRDGYTSAYVLFFSDASISSWRPLDPLSLRCVRPTR
jgi:hypothetical protein